MIAGRLLLVGAGNMAGAMLRRWLDCGLDPAQVTVVSPSGRAQPAGVRVERAVPDEAFDVVMLGLKPQQLGALAGTPLATMRPRLLLSILAGVEEAALAAVCPAAATVRAMPNLPVAIGKGVVLLDGAADDREARSTAETLMAPLGLVEWIADPRLFGAATALSGCGPAFVFRFIDALAAAAAGLGVPADQSARLARATVEGAALLATDADADPATLADRVASPGGSTRAGLNVLDKGDALRALLARTLAASEKRDAELSEIATASLPA